MIITLHAVPTLKSTINLVISRVVVQERQRNVQKSVKQVASCSLAHKTYCTCVLDVSFGVTVVVS